MLGKSQGGSLCSAYSVFDEVLELLFCHSPSGCYIRLRESKITSETECLSLCRPPLFFFVVFQIMPFKKDFGKHLSSYSERTPEG